MTAEELEAYAKAKVKEIITTDNDGLTEQEKKEKADKQVKEIVKK